VYHQNVGAPGEKLRQPSVEWMKMWHSMSEEARMASRTGFTDEEWTRLKRAPLVVGMAISIADPGAPIARSSTVCIRDAERVTHVPRA
jgi:hypothetical protein